jgi:hypothetical protein
MLDAEECRKCRVKFLPGKRSILHAVSGIGGAGARGIDMMALLREWRNSAVL